MKRSFTLFVAMIFSLLLIAQQERVPNNSIIATNYTSAATKAIAQTKTALFADNFEGETSLATNWEVKRSSQLTWEGFTAPTTSWFVCTPQSFSGNGSTYIHSGEKSAAISYNVQGYNWLITKDTLEIPANDENYTLTFWMWYLNSSSYTTNFSVVAYNTDTHLLDTLQQWNQDSESNLYNQIVRISLADYAGKNIRLAFVYQGPDGNQMAIDDITVSNSVEPDLSLKARALKYSAIPHFMVNSYTVTPSAKVTNIGAEFTGTATVTLTIDKLSEYSATADITKALTTNEGTIVNPTPLPSFTEKGMHKLVFDISTSSDANSKNNKDSIQFLVSESLISTDYNTNIGLSLGSSFQIGNLYSIKVPAVATGIHLGWPEGTVSETNQPTYTVKLYELAPTDSTIVRTLFSKTLDQRSNDAIEIPSLLLTPGTNYFVTIQQVGSTALQIGADQTENGGFWKVNTTTQKPERLTSANYGNVAIRLVLSSPVEEPTLSFEVTDGTTPIEDATVIIIGLDTLKTDAQGAASKVLINGEYRYWVGKQGYTSYSGEVKLASANVLQNIMLEPAHPFTFNISSSGTPVENAQIGIADTLLYTNAEGKAIINLADRNYNYNINASGFEPLTGSIAVSPDFTETNIELVAGTTIQVGFNVMDENDQPISMGQVTLSGYGTIFTDESGSVTFIGMPSISNLTYTVYKKGFEVFTQSFSTTGKDTIVDVNLVSLRYKATIFVTNGQSPLANAMVKIADYPEQPTSVTGYAIVEGIAPDAELTLTISKDGYNAYETTISVIEGDLLYTAMLIPVGIETPNVDKAAVYPNPSNGAFEVNANELKRITIFDITGRVVLDASCNSNSKTISIEDEPTGLYLIKIQTTKGMQMVKHIKR
ncbi:hypothetical protein DSECCO2_128010 [anaerobic digester metagenome]